MQILRIERTSQRGAFANRDLEHGELVLWERPLLITPVGAMAQESACQACGAWCETSTSSISNCPAGCSSCRFCSPRCGSIAFSRWHRMLCPVAVDCDRSALGSIEALAAAELQDLQSMSFKVGIVDYTALFQLLAQMIAARACQEARLAVEPPDFFAELLHEGFDPDDSDMDVLSQDREDIFSPFCSADWEEVCSRFGEGEFEGGPSQWRAQRSSLLDRFVLAWGRSHFNQGVFSSILSDRRLLAKWLGLLTQNTAERTPQWDDTVGLMAGTSSARTAGTTCVALFRAHASLNHSCRPNCVVRNPNNATTLLLGVDCVRNGSAVVTTKELVNSGDELTISYIDEDRLDREQRRQLLFDHYDFWCACERCEAENPAKIG